MATSVLVEEPRHKRTYIKPRQVAGFFVYKRHTHIVRLFFVSSCMKRLWLILFLISVVWGQKQSITLKKGDDFILVNQKDRIMVVTKENNEFKGPLSSLEISNAGIKVNDKWETIKSIQLYYPQKYAKRGFQLLTTISLIEILASLNNSEGNSIDILYIFFSGGLGYIGGYISGLLLHRNKLKPMLISEGEWVIVE